MGAATGEPDAPKWRAGFRSFVTGKILFIGDIFGQPGRRAVKEILPRLVEECSPDLVLANGENAAAGFGITPLWSRSCSAWASPS